jgi:2'-5' RNA ligase
MEAPADERWRCFVAASLADPARSAVLVYLDELRAATSGVGWTRPDNLHLTFRFLGDVAATRVPSLVERLRAGLTGVMAFEMRVTGVGAFPSVSRPQVLWVGLESPAIAPLAATVRRLCEAEGFPAEPRAFRPHVTLGRVRTRSRRDAPDLAFLARDGARRFEAAPVREVVLYRSRLGAGGARHSPLAIFPLLPA